jgi:hypothetical protein
MATMRIIATCSGLEPGVWQLCRWDEKDGAYWKCLVLKRPPAARQAGEYATANYRFHWNARQERWTVGSLWLLRRRHPSMYDWLKRTMPIIPADTMATGSSAGVEING